MDISDTLAPTSDQLDAVDLLSGPRTFTIERVSKGNLEQPVQIHLAEFPRPWRPGKSMRRVLVAAWGPDASTYAGRRVTLYCDLEVKFAGERVGGTRISHMSDLKGGKRLSVPLLITRGKSAIFTVEPLTEPVARPATAPPADRKRQVTPTPLARLTAAFGALGIEDRTERLDICSRIVGRTLGSANDLTTQEAKTVIDALEMAAQQESPLLWLAEQTAADPAGDPPMDPAEA